ncbi:DEAD/DEAH box helicase [Leuconostoc pseudomesenteroides]|jgi:superfamily II DNA/RNA helicase|uniref:DEAD/DEAH box helicase n=1 Tax=Leuconostoc TaxID=1243 RepID=UPI0011DD2794|nr:MULTISPECIES: DEAD/DEAH box helicase [Leuconostoc]MBK0039653.1 DEAD/DEAH box helicase [Leuconostoc sp. S51]MBK0050612.1 DEAD/DEAH box helicase [Leuconostoc sp. S50]MBS0957289.1 DEAD/DEAH box helicase [Leuconostoc pseudomesenteroides]MCT4381044.1 DEAD/DEAH box helicase [Leuconostoc pseudomesenteroides]MCT4412213.1 DEAD/DEAH box helicase [Leuconostoc pseudomesenteroides]
MRPELLEKFNAVFEQPTPIQNAVWQRLIDGDSIFGLAPTGTGKTLAFVLPMLSQVDANLKRTQVLILAPSQELAMQTTQVAREWGALVGVSVASLIGGANGRRQAEKLKKDKPQIVVGTLGRVLTMLEGGVLKLDNIKAVIFDEADAMLTEERHASLEALADQLPTNLQLGLFSATSGADLQYVNTVFNQKVHPISVGTDAPANIKHEFQYVDQRAKEKILIQLARHNQQALVFFNTISALVSMQATLRHAHVSVMSIGSNDKRQVQRADALRLFKKGEVVLLLVTDVAARGLDIDNLPLVVNAQLPERLKTYVHRTGRTGRMGKNGRVLNLGNDHDIRNLKRELGDKFTLVKADNTFESSTKTVANKQQAIVVSSKAESDSAKKPSITSSPSKKHLPVKVAAKNDLPERKKKRAKHSKNKGKPKWAKKRD